MKHLRYCLLIIAYTCQPLAASERSTRTVILDAQGERNLGLKTAIAEPRPFEQTLFAVGRLEDVPEARSVLSSRISGRVTAVHAQIGETVRKGDLLLEIESRQAGNPPPKVQLRAPADGLVVHTHARLGEPIEPEAVLMELVNRKRLWAVAAIPEAQAAAIRPGTEANIHLPALGGEPIRARLERFGVEARRDSSTLEGIFLLSNPDGRLQSGMRAEFSLVTALRPDVLAVPRGAVQGSPSKRHVYVPDYELPHAYVKVPVTVGEENDTHAEILSGLFSGDEVVVEGSYQLGFAGSGSGLSLKEALDAAHGHEHNEDGSEMTPEQRAAREREKRGESATAEAGTNQNLLIYAAIVSLLCLYLLPYRFRKPAKTD